MSSYPTTPDNDEDLEGRHRFMQLHELVFNYCAKQLREYFFRTWLRQGYSPFTSSSRNGQHLLDMYDNLYRFSSNTSEEERKRDLVLNSHPNVWEVPLLISAIKAILGQPKHLQLDELREVRNFLSHAPRISLSPEEFEQKKSKVVNCLVFLGVQKEDIEQEMNILDLGWSSENVVLTVMSEGAGQATLKYEEIKGQGNTLFKEGNYKGAVKCYTEGINPEELTTDQLGILYSNRCICNLKLSNLEAAKCDAKAVVTLRPAWPKGFKCLGHIYKAQAKLEKALHNYEIAYSLDPSSGELKGVRDSMKYELECIRRAALLDPINFIRTNEDVTEIIQLQGKKPAYGMNTAIQTPALNWHPFYLLHEARNWRLGVESEGYCKDYRRALECYGKAAEKGWAEGYYFIGKMTMEGQGLQRNIEEGMKLILKAANMPEKVVFIEGSEELFPDKGVMQAQLEIGAAYSMGIYFERDDREALNWFQKAMKNGSGCAPFNIGSYYLQGQGPCGKDIPKALLYFKLAAHRGSAFAMSKLAELFHNESRHEEAKEWALFALHHRAMMTQATDFNITDQDRIGFNPEAFRNCLRDEISKSELKDYVDCPMDEIDKLMEAEKQKGDYTPDTYEIEPNNSLPSTYRAELARNHRNTLHYVRTNNSNFGGHSVKLAHPEKILLTDLKPIFLKGMEYKQNDKIYWKTVIDLKVIEDPTVMASATFLLVQDENGWASRLFIYNPPSYVPMKEFFGFGSSFSLISPYMRRMSDGLWCLRVDAFNTIVPHLLPRDQRMCRFCLKEGSNESLSCKTCERAFYCNKECMEKDKDELEHSKICFREL